MKKEKTTNELLLEGCIAALAAFEDRTKSPIRIRANIRFLKKVISQATEVKIK